MATQSTSELLAQLRGLQMPEAPTEPAVWPVILSAGILLLIGMVFLIRRKRGTTTWAKEAKRELDSIKHNENTHALTQTAALLKRIAITHDNSAEVKRLTGDRWLRYLDSFFQTRYFSEGNGQLFGELKKLIQRKHRSE